MASKPWGYRLLTSFFAIGCLLTALTARAAEPEQDAQSEAAKPADDGKVSASSDDSSSSEKDSDKKSDGADSKYPPLSKVTKDLKTIDDGLIKLHQGDDKLLAELKPADLDKDYIVLITIAKGIGQRPILGGYSWGFGDDWVWQFRKVGERIHVVRRNVRFRADSGSPSEKAVAMAFTDSVLYSLPIITRGSGGSYVVDLGQVFLSDLPQISMVLPGFTFSKSRSTWANVEAHPKNLEVQVAATYASAGRDDFDTVPDSRGVTVGVHYSISRLPESNYKPRLADDRIGYFLTVRKDYSKAENEDRFVRYINRWNLQKADPDAEKSPPKEPIVFWLEKTIPYKYRKPIRDGIAEWNKAFEKAGFYDAIDVRQQPDDATWEPGDINYNTFRWITSSAGFAMGPSRVNPLTGEILDADIIFDADFLQTWKVRYETFTPEGIAAMTGGPIDLESYRQQQSSTPIALRHRHGERCSCNLLHGMSQQFALGASVGAVRKRSPEDLEKLIMQGLKEVTMHEVGHTLGLRHNFKASALYSPAELNDVSKTSKTGLTASVMDYSPVNLAPPGTEQGDYYSTTIGPYDYWAIEYGYKPLKGSTEAELPELKKIAARSGEPGLAYLTDEDTRGIDPDPHSIRFDMSNDLVGWAKGQAAIVADAMPEIVESVTDEGDGYEKARRAFGVLLSTHGQAMFMASRYVGGVYVSRSHVGDENAPSPFEVVDAKQQREALDLIEEQVFSDKPFDIPPKMYNQLAPSRWSHWGQDVVDRPDYPAHEVILLWQERILDRLLSPLTLTRVHDSELKTPSDQDALTTAELLDRLTAAIFAELDADPGDREYTVRTPAVSSLRRNLQRVYLERLARLALGSTSAPQDCQTLAYAELKSLEDKMANVADSDKLDSYTSAHLLESRARIEKTLDAVMLTSP
ncbi:hypothetical protein Pla123a_42940 [Posidoniimonas polymericola]|uniref:Uncharacterized protein n=1 Tax=Posidoniimonas polymericola TaxID=2528002 RepID=A0A5C5XYG2_9BACT|nr:zinc-dependent metalloprotease [Posidoniimonas polymericola]TWT67738.1 hypothetical protein Pla123a_42940 [Posidoniimonas polymericola]